LSDAGEGNRTRGHAVDLAAKCHLDIIATSGGGELRVEQIEKLRAVESRGAIARQRSVDRSERNTVEFHARDRDGRARGVLHRDADDDGPIGAGAQGMRPGEGGDGSARTGAGLVEGNGGASRLSAKGGKSAESEEGNLRPTEGESGVGVHDAIYLC